MATGRGAFGWLNGIVTLVFLIGAGLQYNDPDPLRWILIYGLAAVACLAHRRTTWDRVAAIAVGLTALFWTATLFSGLSGFVFGDLFRSMKAETPTIELGRELLGLWIIAGWMAVLIFRRRVP